ncbi:MAG: DUF2306 domain-containing protein [Chitinophagales bacterium]
MPFYPQKPSFFNNFSYPLFLGVGILLIYGYFCYLMLEITLQYIPINFDVAFLRIKQDYIQLAHYRIAFFVHVFSSIFVLLAGFTQFSKYIRKHYYFIHKWSGWLYGGVVILLAAPSGFLIGVYANGGISSQIAFCLLGILWFLFTVLAIFKAIKKDIVAHRRWIIRSFALTLSAITLRAWKYILVALFHPRPMDVYIIVAWLGWVLNLIIAEFFLFYSSKK